jgi:hypothetical protein
MSPSPSPGEAAARVCLDILRGASKLAQPYAAHLSKLLQEEGREQERALVEGGLPAGGGRRGARADISEPRRRRRQGGELLPLLHWWRARGRRWHTTYLAALVYLHLPHNDQDYRTQSGKGWLTYHPENMLAEEHKR